MRIIIEESDTKARAAATSSNYATTPGLTPIDAGPPAAALVQTVAGADTTDAGGPPEMLLQALQNTASTNAPTFSTGAAGAAPTR